jgi:microcystin-dependent protein
MSTEPFIGAIAMFAGNFAPRGWAFCQGQLLSISQNTALFSILGTTYGGNGQTTFALPNLQSRVAIGAGQGPGLSNYDLGQTGGSETVTLSTSQMAAHTHVLSLALNVKNYAGNSRTPVGNVLANEAGGVVAPFSTASPDGTMAAGALSGTATSAGSSLPVQIIQPYLTINYIIAMEGIYPSRN